MNIKILGKINSFIIIIIFLLLLSTCNFCDFNDKNSSISNNYNNNYDRIVAFGDIHGDISSLRAVLKKANLINNYDNWIGGATAVVQTGDITDRGDEELQVIQLLEKLKIQSENVGGKIFTLNGNHEIMNVKLNFKYVSSSGFSTFARAFGSRENAFKPGGPVAKILSRSPVVLVLNGYVFTHGGVKPNNVIYGIDKINQEVKDWMLGKNSYLNSHADDIVWARDYSKEPGESACKMLEETLNLLDAKRMIMGHTVQNGISSACNGKAIRIDVGMSDYYGGKIEALLIENDRLYVIR